MIHQATHYIESGAKRAVCGRGLLTVVRTTDPSNVTCKQCLHKLNAPEFVGESRGRKQYKLVCQGGPWDGQETVFARQESSPLSIMIRVGEHVGWYNLNTGAWVPMEQQA